jgi:hypothetical protein
LDPNSEGESIAKSASELLQELNEDANVNFVEKVRTCDEKYEEIKS